MVKRFLILFGCACMAGCVPHFKEVDSYNTLFRNDEIKQMPMKGDPYTFGGIADGSGGTIARQSYATDNDASDPRNDTAKVGAFDKDRTPSPDAKPITGLEGDGARRSFDRTKQPVVSRGGPVPQ